MSKTYDCAIVGAGPAGATAAYNLAKHGRDVLILEKETLPRYKPCGGGVSPQIKKWLDFDLSPVISLEVKKVCYSWSMKDLIDIELEVPIWMVRRDLFDHFLVTHSIKKGATLKENEKVIKIKFEENYWTIDTACNQYKSHYLIAADGAKGQTAKFLGFDNRKKLIGGAIEAESSFKNPDDKIAFFEFGMVKSGYLWNFPKADGYSFGIAIFKTNSQENLKNILEQYSKMFNINYNSAIKYGHPIYIWDGNQKLHTENKRAILTGEAACLVDPLTLEGIRPSIFSGYIAANAVHKALLGDNQAVEKYTNIIKDELGQDMKWAEKLSKILYSYPKLCYKHIFKKNTAVKAMSKIFSGEMRYRDLPTKAFKSLEAIIFN